MKSSCSSGLRTSFQITIFLVTILQLSLSARCVIHCNKVVKIISKEPFSYLGNLTFTVSNTFSGHWTLEMKTDVPFIFIGGWGVEIKEDCVNGEAKFYNTEPQDLKTGDIISFEFRLYWEPLKQIPEVQELIWENYRLCRGVRGVATAGTEDYQIKTVTNISNIIVKKYYV